MEIQIKNENIYLYEYMSVYWKYIPQNSRIDICLKCSSFDVKCTEKWSWQQTSGWSTKWCAKWTLRSLELMVKHCTVHDCDHRMGCSIWKASPRTYHSDIKVVSQVGTPPAATRYINTGLNWILKLKASRALKVFGRPDRTFGSVFCTSTKPTMSVSTQREKHKKSFPNFWLLQWNPI